MDAGKEIREFLTTRRAKITPSEAGLPTFGGYRRVPGLRREEVALLAGVSVDYYTRLGRGNAAGVSTSVLAGIARALQLDEAERSHLFDLANAAQPRPRQIRRKPQARIRPSVQRLLDSMTAAPALVRNNRFDILASNRIGHALYFEFGDGRSRSTNTARFLFLDPRSADFYVDLERSADDVVASLRSEAGRDPHDRNLIDLIGELSTQSDAFRKRWAMHNVRFHDSGVKRLRHPVVGEMTLSYEAMPLAADVGLTLFAYTAEAGSDSERALERLGQWAVEVEAKQATEKATA